MLHDALQQQDDSKTKRNKIAKHKRGQLVSLVFLLCALGLIGYAGFGVYRWWRATHHADAVPSESAEVTEPSEVPLPTTGKPPFDYAADQPMKIDLPSIGVSGYIQKVVQTKNNAVGVPSNINLAGWYTKSTVPGDSGLSIIDGHVQGRYNPGIFQKLKELKPDDVLSIIFGDQHVKKFRVVSVKSYPTAEAASALFSHDPALPHQLNLITCDGIIENGQQSYDKRVVVVARLEE